MAFEGKLLPLADIDVTHLPEYRTSVHTALLNSTSIVKGCMSLAALKTFHDYVAPGISETIRTNAIRRGLNEKIVSLVNFIYNITGYNQSTSEIAGKFFSSSAVSESYNDAITAYTIGTTLMELIAIPWNLAIPIYKTALSNAGALALTGGSVLAMFIGHKTFPNITPKIRLAANRIVTYFTQKCNDIRIGELARKVKTKIHAIYKKLREGYITSAPTCSDFAMEECLCKNGLAQEIFDNVRRYHANKQVNRLSYQYIIQTNNRASTKLLTDLVEKELGYINPQLTGPFAYYVTKPYKSMALKIVKQIITILSWPFACRCVLKFVQFANTARREHTISRKDIAFNKGLWGTLTSGGIAGLTYTYQQAWFDFIMTNIEGFLRQLASITDTLWIARLTDNDYANPALFVMEMVTLLAASRAQNPVTNNDNDSLNALFTIANSVHTDDVCNTLRKIHVISKSRKTQYEDFSFGQWNKDDQFIQLCKKSGNVVATVFEAMIEADDTGRKDVIGKVWPEAPTFELLKAIQLRNDHNFNVYSGTPSDNCDLNTATIRTGDLLKNVRDPDWCHRLLMVKNDHERNYKLFETLRDQKLVYKVSARLPLQTKRLYKTILYYFTRNPDAKITREINTEQPWWSIITIPAIKAMHKVEVADNPLQLRWGKHPPSYDDFVDAILTRYTVDEWRTAERSPFSKAAIETYWPTNPVQGPFIERVAVTAPELLALLAPVCNLLSIARIIKQYIKDGNASGLDMFLCGIVNLSYIDKETIYKTCKNKDKNLDIGCVCILLHHGILYPNMGRPGTPFRNKIDDAIQPERVTHDLREASRSTMLNRIGMKCILRRDLFKVFVEYVKIIIELPEHLEEARWVVQAWRSKLTHAAIKDNFFQHISVNKNDIHDRVEKYERIGIRIKQAACAYGDTTIWPIKNLHKFDVIDKRNEEYHTKVGECKYTYIQRNTYTTSWWGRLFTQLENTSPPRPDENWPWTPAFEHNTKKYILYNDLSSDIQQDDNFKRALKAYKPIGLRIVTTNLSEQHKSIKIGERTYDIVKSNNREFTDV